MTESRDSTETTSSKLDSSLDTVDKRRKALREYFNDTLFKLVPAERDPNKKSKEISSSGSDGALSISDESTSNSIPSLSYSDEELFELDESKEDGKISFTLSKEAIESGESNDIINDFDFQQVGLTLG